MRCPSCGANITGAFCEYCGAKAPVERVETQSIHAENVVVNNYYYQEPQRPFDAGNRANAGVGISPKSRGIALLLCVFFGYFGVHRFYAGRYLMGALYLVTLGLFGIGWLVDILLVLLGRMRDRNGLPISNW